MNNTKFTPGPWVVEENYALDRTQVAAFEDSGNRGLQILIDSNNQSADTSLIAAAPELYDCLSKIHERCLSGDFYNDYDSGLKMLSDARAALAKARGETE